MVHGPFTYDKLRQECSFYQINLLILTTISWVFLYRILLLSTGLSTLSNALRCVHRRRRGLFVSNVLVALNCLPCVFLFGARRAIIPNLQANSTSSELEDSSNPADWIFVFPVLTWPTALCIAMYYLKKDHDITMVTDASEGAKHTSNIALPNKSRIVSELEMGREEEKVEARAAIDEKSTQYVTS